MIAAIKSLLNPTEAKKTAGKKRSSQWPAVRRKHLENNSQCAVCGGRKNLQVHHIHPFHTHPELELSASNLITLCEKGNPNINCHITYGHLGSYSRINENVVEDARIWAAKLQRR